MNLRQSVLVRPILWALPTALLLVLALVTAFAPLRGSAYAEPTVLRPERFAPITTAKRGGDHTWGGWSGETPDERWLGEPGDLVKPTVQSVASVQAASEALSRPVRVPAVLPTGMRGAPEAKLMTAGSATYTLDLAKLHAALAEVGISGLQLPTSLHGATLAFNQPAKVLLSWQGDDGARLVVAQSRQPTLTVAGEVDLAALRELLLNQPAVSSTDPDAVAQLLRVEDWRRTVPVPVPNGVSASAVRVDGADGLLLSGAQDGVHRALVLWQRAGTLYAVGGTTSSEAVLATANSLS